MRVILGLVVIFGTSLGAESQYAVNDAMRLRALLVRMPVSPGSPDSAYYFDEAKIDMAYGILLRYAVDPVTGRTPSTDKDLYRLYVGNDFISTYLPAAPASPTPFAGLDMKSLASSIGGWDVTSLADGMARFLIERGKEELEAAFIKSFRDSIQTHEELKILFPSTATLLAAFEPRNVATYINALREAFNKDLKSLPRSIVNLKYLKQHDGSEQMRLIAGFVRTGNGRAILCSAELADDIMRRRPVPETIDSITSADLMGGAPNQEDRNVFILLRVISNSLRDTTASGYVTPEKMANLLADPAAGDLYLGFIRQQLYGLGVRLGGVDVASLFNRQGAGSAVKYMTRLLEDITRLSVSLDGLGRAMGKQTDELAAANFGVLKDIERLLTACATMIQYDRDSYLPDGALKMLDLASYSFSMVNDISLRNYNALVVDALELLKRGGFSDATLTRLARYISFAANVVTAEDAGEVKAAIQAAALPPGSYQIKRESRFDVSLNGYIGLFVGADEIRGMENSKSTSYGMSAPIGVGFSWGHTLLLFNTGSVPWSTTLYLSFVDVGAVAAYRAGEDSISSLPTVQLKDIFSLGGYLSIGLPNLPVSVSIGGQTGPNLYSVRSAASTGRSVPYYRLSFSVCVDIPLVSLHSIPLE